MVNSSCVRLYLLLLYLLDDNTMGMPCLKMEKNIKKQKTTKQSKV